MEEFKESTRRAFKQCRSDIDSLKFENVKLKGTVHSLESTNSQLNETITELTSEIKGIKIALDYIKGFQEKANSQLPQPQQPVQNLYNQPNQNMYSQPVHQQIPTQDPYEALLAFKAKSNKRKVLQQKLLSMISENGMNISELKFMFVEHHRYCSKATFYNYLKELEAGGTIRQERVNGKPHLYLSETITDELSIR